MVAPPLTHVPLSVLMVRQLCSESRLELCNKLEQLLNGRNTTTTRTRTRTTTCAFQYHEQPNTKQKLHVLKRTKSNPPPPPTSPPSRAEPSKRGGIIIFLLIMCCWEAGTDENCTRDEIAHSLALEAADQLKNWIEWKKNSFFFSNAQQMADRSVGRPVLFLHFYHQVQAFLNSNEKFFVFVHSKKSIDGSNRNQH